MHSKKALQILKKYVGSQRYGSKLPKPTPEEEVYAIAEEVMFPPEKLTHNEVISEIKRLAEEIDINAAARAFLYSLSTSDRQYRTALSSLIWAKSLPVHAPDHSRAWNGTEKCKICGLYTSEKNKTAELLFNEYSLHRFFPDTWDICAPGYVLHDLREFKKLPPADFTEEDVKILRRIFGLASQISPSNKVNALVKLIGAEKFFNATGSDIYTILGVLCICGVFDTPDRKSCAGGFVPNGERDFVYEKDLYYPLNYWLGKYGINYEAVNRVFGEVCGCKFGEENTLADKVQRRPARERSTDENAERFFAENGGVTDLTDRERYYYGLEQIHTEWDEVCRCSVSGKCVYRRVRYFFDGDILRKIIDESVNMYNADAPGGYYLESDMNVHTKERRLVLPKTSRGRPQPLNPSLIETPTYMEGHLTVGMGVKGRTYVTSFNSRNDRELPLPAADIYSKDDLRAYTERYIASLPDDYDKQLDNFRNKKRVTVKFGAGDIFRIQLSPTEYTYCLILGKVRQIEKWKELPEKHPMRCAMCRPIIYRQYNIKTENPNMTAQELEKIPLLIPQTAQDNFVLWETYPIVCHKELKEEDIDIGFHYYKGEMTWNFTMHSFDTDELPDELKNAHADTFATRLAIGYETDLPVDPKGFRLEKLKKLLAEYLGLGDDFTADDFAELYGGMTRKEFIEKISGSK